MLTYVFSIGEHSIHIHFRLKATAALALIVISFSLFTSLAKSSASGPAHTSLCYAGNYLLLGNVITNGADTRITSVYAGAIVGGVSPADLLALVGSEAGVSNELNSTAHINAISSLGRTLDETTSLAIPITPLSTSEIASNHSGQFPLGTYGAGIYTTTGAMTITAASVITLDAAGDPNANFYFISGAAFTVGANVVINLANGAQAKNVYWVAGSFKGDMSIGATSVLYGNFLVGGAVTLELARI